MPNQACQKRGPMFPSWNMVNHPEQHDEIELLGSQRRRKRFWLDDEIVLVQTYAGKKMPFVCASQSASIAQKSSG